MLKIAIIGAGKIGLNHAGCYERNPHALVVAFCDVIREKAEEAAGKFGCRAFYSVEEMLGAGLEIDAASVCTAGEENGGDHYLPTMALLKAGIPLLGEKPISNKVEEAREMVALGKEKNLPYGINLNHRFTPAAERAKEWVAEGRLGPLNFINMRLWINNKKESSEHFHMRALHPHSLDVMRYFGGEVEKVQAFFKKGEGRRIWSNAQVNLLFQNGIIGHLLGSYDGGGPKTPWGLETCEIVGSKARIIIEDACEKLVFSPRFSWETKIYHCPGGMLNFGETFQSRINRWIDDLIKGTPIEAVEGKAEDALKVQIIIEAAIESWKEGRVVTVEN